ncbi:hypothetical protein JCM10212_003688 [Sporobolomyces blumeae]
MPPKKSKGGKKKPQDDDAYWEAKAQGSPAASGVPSDTEDAPSKSGKKAAGGFASLMVDDAHDDDDDDDGGLMAQISKANKAGGKKDKKNKKKQQQVDDDDYFNPDEDEGDKAKEEDLAAPRGAVDAGDDWMEEEFGGKASKKGGKKGGKKGKKQAVVDEDDEDDVPKASEPEVDLAAPRGAEEAGDDWMEDEFGDSKKKGKKGGKKGGKQQQQKQAEEEAEAEDDAAVEEVTKKVEEVKLEEAPAEKQDEAEDDGAPKLLSKKEKEKLKKEKEKAKKKAQAAAKKAAAGGEAAPAPAPDAEAPAPAVADAGEGEDGDDAGAGGDASSKNKKKKKKKAGAAAAEPAKEEAPAPGKKGKGAGGQMAALRALVEAQRKAAEEQARREEEERLRIEEEERKAEEEERLKEEERARKKEKEKAKKEQLRKEGKLLTPKQKAERAAAEARRQALMKSGVIIAGLQDKDEPEAGPKKVSYGNRKRGGKNEKKDEQPVEEEKPKKAEEKKAEEKKVEVKEPEKKAVEEAKKADEDEEDVKDSWDASSSDEEEEKKEEDEDVKDSWDASSSEEEEEPVKKAAPAANGKENGKSAAAAAGKKQPPAVQSSVPSKGKAAPAAKGKAAAAAAEESDDSDDSDDSDEDSDDDSDDDSDGESDDDSEDERTATEKQLAQRKAEAKERRLAKNEAALAERSKDNLRSPICVIMGHVDTGKTKLLDKIRQTNVQEGEAGGITQQIGATYFPMEAIRQKTRVLGDADLKEYKLPGLLVIDTPGHESFTNLRSRGSSLCNIAILVVDIMHGLEQQTLESLRMLRDGKTPFIVALNKIDRLYGWQAMKDGGFQQTLAQQNRAVQREYEKRLQETIVAFAEQGLNAVPYYDNKNFAKNVSLVPTSAHTGEGVPDMLMLIIKLTQERMAERLMYISTLECTVLEVKVIEGLGTTIDVVLSNGVLNEGDKIVVCGLNGAIVTQVRALLTPQPMKELRIKGQYVHHKTVKASLGIKIVAPELEKAIAGSRLLVCGEDDDEDELREEVMSDLTNLMDSVDKSGRGVCVQASTLGSLEALLEFLRVSKIPVSGINIGPVHKKDVMRCSTMLEKAKELAVILCFDVAVDKDAEKLADEVGIKIFKADIIYHLFDQFKAYNAEMVAIKRADAAPIAVWPCRLKIITCFAKRDPIILGCDIIEGSLRVGTPLCVIKVDPETKKREVISLGKVSSLEINKKAKDVVKKHEVGGGVAVKIEHASYENAKQFGRHFDEKDEVVSMVSRNSIDALKEHFRAEVPKEDWLLIKSLKTKLDIP